MTHVNSDVNPEMKNLNENTDHPRKREMYDRVTVIDFHYETEIRAKKSKSPRKCSANILIS